MISSFRDRAVLCRRQCITIFNIGFQIIFPEDSSLDCEEIKHTQSNLTILKMFLALFFMGKYPLLSKFISMNPLESAATFRHSGCCVKPAIFRAALPGSDSTHLPQDFYDGVKPAPNSEMTIAGCNSCFSSCLSKEEGTSAKGNFNHLLADLCKSRSFQSPCRRRKRWTSHIYPLNLKAVGKGFWWAGGPAE